MKGAFARCENPDRQGPTIGRKYLEEWVNVAVVEWVMTGEGGKVKGLATPPASQSPAPLSCASTHSCAFAGSSHASVTVESAASM